MPMSFPDMDSLKREAKVHGFRQPSEDENEDVYRNALADYVSTIDRIEGEEIRNKVGWDQWNEMQKSMALFRFMTKKGD